MKLVHALAAIAMTATTLMPQESAATPFEICNTTEIVFFEGTIVDAAIATPELSTLVTAVVAAGLADALAEAEDITVYAPTDEAFGKLSPDVLNAALADVDLLTAILLYHVNPGLLDPRKWINVVKIPTLLGQDLYIYRKEGQQRVNNSAINCMGVRTDNGMVWLIDSVLMPQS